MKVINKVLMRVTLFQILFLNLTVLERREKIQKGHLRKYEQMM